MKGISTFILLCISFIGNAQFTSISGKVTSSGEPLEFVTVKLKGTGFGEITDQNGNFTIKNVPHSIYNLVCTSVGYEAVSIEIDTKTSNTKNLNIELKESSELLNQFVVTGTKTFKRRTESPVIVGVIDSKVLSDVQACNISDGLKFQPGLRVETDCQTCNYTQLRMNGLGGGYSQVLINGRPIFSALTGLYGLEQIPSNMVERIEVVRGGGSALYGSSAIGGTVNIITKIPKKSGYSLDYNYQNINGAANDHLLSANATLLNPNEKSGATFFFNSRDRQYYDHNGDNFSELPQLKNRSFGTNLFFQPTKNQKLEVSLSILKEYRYGGEMVNKPAYLTQQSEERNHDVYLGSADYQINFNGDSNSVIFYVAGQATKRDHYTGILPDDSVGLINHYANSPYGTSDVSTFQGGLQFNQKIKSFNNQANVLTFGAEYLMDEVYDEINAYNYEVDQSTTNFGVYGQSDWGLSKSLNLLLGLRMDKHNFVEQPIFSPRVSFLYKLKNTTQFRLTWGTGFRAPQAFDADLHIAFAGGGVSRVFLSEDLQPERSQSLSASINYDLPQEKYVIGFTAEGFYTYLKDAFYLHHIGDDQFGEVFEKRNGIGATVQGATLELRGNFNKKMQLEAGVTIQTSQYDSAVVYNDNLPAKSNFLRSPNTYGYGTLSLYPSKKLSLIFNLVYTGPMEILHFAGAPEQSEDEYKKTDDFTNLSFKLNYTINLKKMDSSLQPYLGIKNIFNAYQSDFDTGKNRDSNYIYGPATPRTFYIGVRLTSL